MISTTKLAACFGLWFICCYSVHCSPYGGRNLNDFSSDMSSFDDEFRPIPDTPDFYQIRRRMKQETKRTAAMGVDLPDYILHFKGNWPDLTSFRDRMQKSGKR
ncbi:uncharacterized protein LOC111084896 [Limulus polyphemus]|uniref:Uncharacterized protein LOC111084896 n=1 Tax=Limulus polyphemus TaxID=6850 RepID=A0ABM1S0E7_LIMPO|nr:uncharacterized protein LOC111084896 [Limulus polyphemus]XP_022237103.1 uncharacterized protein LOC111084896 [Limulus polyphemus]